MRKLVLFLLILWGAQQAVKKAIEGMWPEQTPRERDAAERPAFQQELQNAAREQESREWRDGGRQEAPRVEEALSAAARGSDAVPPVASDPMLASDAAWRARIEAARREVESARREYEGWQGHTLVPGYVLADKRTSQTVVPSIEALQARTRAAKERLESAQRSLEDLEEQARRANVTPGALR